MTYLDLTLSVSYLLKFQEKAHQNIRYTFKCESHACVQRSQNKCNRAQTDHSIIRQETIQLSFMFSDNYMLKMVKI